MSVLLVDDEPAEGLALEARVFAEHVARLTPEAIARNRAAVQDRGRALAGLRGGPVTAAGPRG
jgi:hypothetical protein